MLFFNNFPGFEQMFPHIPPGQMPVSWIIHLSTYLKDAGKMMGQKDEVKAQICVVMKNGKGGRYDEILLR